MLSDIAIAEAAEAELNAPFPAGDEPAGEEPSTPHEESDQMESDESSEEEAQPEEEPTEEEEVKEEEEEEEPEEETKEEPVLPEDHDPDATLSEEQEPEKEPQHRVDARNLAEKWDFLTDEEQELKVQRLQKSGRLSTLQALAKELGTTVDHLLPERKREAAKGDEIAELKKKLTEMESAVGYAKKQAENDRFVAEITKWADHNKFDEEETKDLLKIDGELRNNFRSLRYDPVTGEELSYNMRLRLALKQSDSVQEALTKKMVTKELKARKEGLKAALPNSGTSNATSASRKKNLSPEEELRMMDEQFGARVW